MGLEGLGGLVLETILSKLEPRDLAVLACVSSRLSAAASQDNLWREFCSSQFDLSSPEDPQGNPCRSFKLTYETWVRSFSMYPLSIVKRVKQCWTAIRNWMTINFPKADDTLRRGATEAEIKQAEEKLGVKLPIPVRLLYRFCDGQDTVAYNASQHRRPLGTIGGYEFYEHLVNVHLLSLSQIMKQSKEFEGMIGVKSKHIVVAMSMYLDKWFFLDCGNGQLYVGTENLFITGEMIPCVPYALVKSGTDAVNGLPHGAIVLWLEEHCRRLYSGAIKTRHIRKIQLICLYPDVGLQPPVIRDSGMHSLHLVAPPSCSIAVTNGVQVRASAVFVPELSSLDSERRYFYSYSIRMSLLPEGCMSNGLYYSTCQLSVRHWIIKAKDNVVANVSGEGVIGLFPHLTPDSEEFVYESCTPVPSVPGTVEGSFTFVPGSLARPEGPAFEVKVAPFALEVPEYIF